MLDPGADGRRIGCVDGARYLARVMFPAVLVRYDGCVEPKHSAGSDADPVPRNGAEHECAGRQARSVNDDPLARFSNLGEELEIADDRTARARHDAHVGERRRRGNDGQDDSEDAPSSSSCNRQAGKNAACAPWLQ